MSLLKKVFGIEIYQIPSGTIMLFGNASAPTGWTKKTDWQDNAMLCYASGAPSSGGAVDPQATHTHTGPSHNHKFYDNHENNQHDESYNTGGDAQTVPAGDQKVGAYAHIVRSVDTTDYPLNDCFTNLAGTGATGANSAPLFQEVIAATKD